MTFLIGGKTEFEVIKSYKGDVKNQTNIYDSNWFGGSCGLYFGARDELIVFAYSKKNGKLISSTCALHSHFKDEQFIKFFENGIDSSALKYPCIEHLQHTYEAPNISGEFSVKDETCMAVKPLYDQVFRKAN